MYDKNKLRTFNEYSLRDYYSHVEIENICNVKEVTKTDGSFTQIGIRPMVPEDMFLKDEDRIYRVPELPSIGMIVANGERDFLIRNILDNNLVQKIKLNKKEIKNFASYAYDFREATILVSLDFYVELSMSLAKRIEYKDYKTILDSCYSLIFVPGDLMKGKIIILDKNAVLWEKQKFHNEFTKKYEKIDIKVIPAKKQDKADVTVKSVNKIKYINPELIRILEVEE